MEHSKLKRVGLKILFQDGPILAEMNYVGTAYESHQKEQEKHADRLVKCWNEYNAQKKLITKYFAQSKHFEELNRTARLEADSYLKIIEDRQAEYDTLKAKADLHDELVDALKEIVRHTELRRGLKLGWDSKVLSVAIEALAKCKAVK